MATDSIPAVNKVKSFIALSLDYVNYCRPNPHVYFAAQQGSTCYRNRRVPTMANVNNPSTQSTMTHAPPLYSFSIHSHTAAATGVGDAEYAADLVSRCELLAP
jgi:hypothetical protein